MRLLQRFVQVIAPPICALCGGKGQARDETWGLDLCEYCEQECPPLANACPRCGLPVAGDDTATCTRCNTSPPPYDGVFSLFEYADPVDCMITGLKFRHDLAFARVLGTLLARRWRACGQPVPDCLVPMPLHRSRLRERGFCQTTLIARHIAHRIRGPDGRRLPVRTDLLERSRPTSAQSGLAAAQRSANVRDAFRVRRPPVPQRVALLDDVLTTGATAAAAATALKAAGARHVQIWCCARALPAKER